MPTSVGILGDELMVTPALLIMVKRNRWSRVGDTAPMQAMRDLNIMLLG